MSIVGYILLGLICYECFVAATINLIQKIPPIEQNYWHTHHFLFMSLIFPVSILFFNIVPRGYRIFYLACVIIQFGSLITWIGVAISFIFLPWSWWWYAGIVAATFILGLFVPSRMAKVMREIGYFRRT